MPRMCHRPAYQTRIDIFFVLVIISGSIVYRRPHKHTVQSVHSPRVCCCGLWLYRDVSILCGVLWPFYGVLYNLASRCSLVLFWLCHMLVSCCPIASCGH